MNEIISEKLNNICDYIEKEITEIEQLNLPNIENEKGYGILFAVKPLLKKIIDDPESDYSIEISVKKSDPEFVVLKVKETKEYTVMKIRDVSKEDFFNEVYEDNKIHFRGTKEDCENWVKSQK